MYWRFYRIFGNFNPSYQINFKKWQNHVFGLNEQEITLTKDPICWKRDFKPFLKSPTVRNSDWFTRWGPHKQDKILFITKDLTIFAEKNAYFSKSEKNDCNWNFWNYTEKIFHQVSRPATELVKKSWSDHGSIRFLTTVFKVSLTLKYWLWIGSIKPTRSAHEKRVRFRFESCQHVSKNSNGSLAPRYRTSLKIPRSIYSRSVEAFLIGEYILRAALNFLIETFFERARLKIKHRAYRKTTGFEQLIEIGWFYAYAIIWKIFILHWKLYPKS